LRQAGNLAVAQNAVQAPAVESPVVAQSLSATERVAVESIVTQEQILQQQQQQFMNTQVRLNKDRMAVIADIEKAHCLPSGSILRGEWAIIDGNLIQQGE
jgi:hypothetical protein